MKNILIALALISASSAGLHATTITDGTFANWSLGGIGNGGMTLEASGGNSGERLNVTTFTTIGVFAYGIGINENFFTTDTLSGAFSLSLDVKSGPGDFGAGQSIALLVRQGSDVYAQFLGNTIFPHSGFDTLSFNGTFNAAMFSHWAGSGSAMPDFSGGTTTYFGFSAYNASNNRSVTEYYDNFSLTYASAPGVPDNGSASLLLLAGLATLAVGARRR